MGIILMVGLAVCPTGNWRSQRSWSGGRDRDAAEVTVAHVAGDIHPPRRTLALDHVGSGYDGYVHNLAQWNMSARRRFDQALAHSAQIHADFRYTPHGNLIHLLLPVDFADRSALDQRCGRSPYVARRQAEKQGALTVFAVVDAMIRLARELTNAGARSEADQQAARLLTLAA